MGSSYLQNKEPWIYKSPWGYREPVPTRPRSSEDSFEFERLGQLPGPRGPPSWFCHQESAPEVENGKWSSWWTLARPTEEGWPPHFPRAEWAATKELLRINKYRIEKIRKELASEECEYLENAGEGRQSRLFCYRLDV